MSRTIIVGAIAVVAIFAGVLYFAGDFSKDSAAKAVPAKTEAVRPVPASDVAARPPVSKSTVASRPVTSDPRLAALIVSADNGLIEFFADPEGRVIREIDNDPNSPGFRRPLREYTYAGNQVIRLVSYRYLGDQVQIVQADVTYKPDGSVDKYDERTDYVYEKKGKDGG